ncbi:MAG: YybS family protein [Deltaproteobacteria bacterium]|nr:YybS family protein [Deltaproteobacteria bacterium]
MDANELTREGRPPLRLQGILGLGLMSLALYLSGVLVWLTPLPIFYAYKNGRGLKSLSGVLLPAILLVSVYGILMPMSVDRFGAEQSMKFFFWLPGMGLGSESTWEPAIFGIVYFLFFAMLGALLGEMEPESYSVTRLIGEAVGVLALSLFLWVFFYSWGHWGEFVRGIESYFIKMLQELTKVPPANEEMQTQWSLLKDHASGIAYFAARLLPGMILNLMIFLLWLNIVVARRLFGGVDKVFSSLGPLKAWRLPFLGVWIVIGFAFLAIFDAYVLKIEWLKLAAMNAFIVFTLVYFFQGLAIVAFYLNRWKLSPMIRLALYSVLILFFQPLSFLLVAFGFFDSWFDFRKLAVIPRNI